MHREIIFSPPNIDVGPYISMILDETNRVGFYSLPDHRFSTKQLEKYKSFDEVVLIGIGGSSLGTDAIYTFLKGVKKLKKLTILDTTDPVYLNAAISSISKNSLYIVISKSGSTFETMTIFKFLKHRFNSSNLIVITGKNSALENEVKPLGIPIYYVPDNVGGRFSVLSPVGLVPLYLLGVDVEKLLEGARLEKEKFFSNPINSDISKKAAYFSLNHGVYTQNVVFAYSYSFEKFIKWYIQLWAESLGKYQNNSALSVGLTPIGLIGPNDQHSFLQLIMEGRQDKTVTFLQISNFDFDIQLSKKLSFGEIINMQASAIREALISKNIPVDIIQLESISELEIGKLIYYFEILTSLVAKMLNVNCFNQPGVELGKQILKQKLSDI